jgi:pilus assembly protein CpaC
MSRKDKQAMTLDHAAARRPALLGARLPGMLAGLLAAVLLAAPLALPMPTYAADTAHLRIGPNSYGRTQMVSLELNRSLIVDLPAEVREVIVSQPTIVGAIMRSKNRAILQGATAGSTNILFLDARGEPISVLDVTVGGDSSALSAAIARILPNSRIQVESFGGRVVLSGSAASQDDAAKAVAIASQFSGGGDNVANLIKLDGSQQVMLKVTIAEVSRETVKQLGINLSGAVTVGSVNLGLNSAQSDLANGITAGLAIPNVQIDAAIQALQQRGAVRTLAEPTLTAMSGQTADFFVGGEFPTLAGIDDGVREFTYRRFGVELNFTPTVKSDGLIGLAVETDVSELAESGFDTGSGIIPGFNSRQTKTTVELRAGTTLTIAGLIQDKVRQQIAGLPGLSDIPILGTLFRSRQYQRNQTELVVLVTPYLAYAGPAPALPTDSYVVAGDAEAVFLGHMEKMYGVGPGGMRGSYRGSIGFMLD